MTPKYILFDDKKKRPLLHYKRGLAQTFGGQTTSNVLPLLLLDLSAYTLGWWPSHVQCPYVNVWMAIYYWNYNGSNHLCPMDFLTLNGHKKVLLSKHLCRSV